MNTWQAALAHIGLAAAQSAAGVSFFNNTNAGGAMANIGIQLGIQFALTALQVFVANKNSNTDPNGAKLVQTDVGMYTTSNSK